MPCGSMLRTIKKRKRRKKKNLPINNRVKVIPLSKQLRVLTRVMVSLLAMSKVRRRAPNKQTNDLMMKEVAQMLVIPWMYALLIISKMLSRNYLKAVLQVIHRISKSLSVILNHLSSKLVNFMITLKTSGAKKERSEDTQKKNSSMKLIKTFSVISVTRREK